VRSEPDLKTPELLRPRLEVLKAALLRVAVGNEEGIGTVRRMGKVFHTWALDEDLKEIEEAALSVVEAKASRISEAGERLRSLLEKIVALVGTGDSQVYFVLAVEDNPDDALFLDIGLSSDNRTVQIVNTVTEALEILIRETVALLVLDLDLPDGDGRAILAQVRDLERYRELPILVVSGKSAPEVEAECLALGAEAYFRKPIEPPAIAAAASSALRRAAKRRSSVQEDPLSQLLNRTAIRELWERWTFPEPSSIGIVGIDQFRALEERFDHEIADSVIRAVGGVLKESIPRGCVSARWEESEFLILCPGLDRATAAGHLAEVLTAVREMEHRDARAETFRVTVSGGVAEIGARTRFDDAVREAKALLEEAMEEGGNTLADAAGPEEAVTILFAEDDPLSAAVLQHRLEREGFTVLHFEDGAQALEGALSHQVSLAVLDVKMPGMDGFELLERLRKVPAYFDLPIIMLTSMGRKEDIARGFDLGADDYMVKPFSPVEVLARIRRLLSR
jgi:diguanylate cyclase (GGDEF)-like protein